MPRLVDIASAIRGARSGAISAADRAVLADVEWRNRSAADNSARVALAVLDYAAGIAEAAEDGVEQRIRKMVEDGYRRDGQTRWSGGEILDQLGTVDTVTQSEPAASTIRAASTYWWAKANDIGADCDRLRQEVRDAAAYFRRLADAARVNGDHDYADAYEHAAERTMRTLTLATAPDA